MMLTINSGSMTCFKASINRSSSPSPGSGVGISSVLVAAEAETTGTSNGTATGALGGGAGGTAPGGPTRMAPSRTMTEYVVIGFVAGMQSGLPVLRSKRAPGRGHMNEGPSTGPSVNGCPSCEQTSSTAKNSSPTCSNNAGASSTTIDKRPPE